MYKSHSPELYENSLESGLSKSATIRSSSHNVFLSLYSPFLLSTINVCVFRCACTKNHLEANRGMSFLRPKFCIPDTHLRDKRVFLQKAKRTFAASLSHFSIAAFFDYYINENDRDGGGFQKTPPGHSVFVVN